MEPGWSMQKQLNFRLMPCTMFRETVHVDSVGAANSVDTGEAVSNENRQHFILTAQFAEVHFSKAREAEVAVVRRKSTMMCELLMMIAAGLKRAALIHLRCITASR